MRVASKKKKDPHIRDICIAIWYKAFREKRQSEREKKEKNNVQQQITKSNRSRGWLSRTKSCSPHAGAVSAEQRGCCYSRHTQTQLYKVLYTQNS